MLRHFFEILLETLVKHQESFILLKGSKLTIPGIVPHIPVASIIKSLDPSSILLIIVQELKKNRPIPNISPQDTGDV
jgi:hypothetical protein